MIRYSIKNTNNSSLLYGKVSRHLKSYLCYAGVLLVALSSLTACGKIKSWFFSPSSEVAIVTTPHGNITIRFFEDIAPEHVTSFKKLTRQGFYNGTTFHRVIPGFMIQGGDPLSKNQEQRHLHGTGGPGYSIPAEFSDRKHTRGIVSAARSANPNSAGSQFFIMVANSPHLDGKYSVFGQVTEGMDVVDKIVAEKRDEKRQSYSSDDYVSSDFR